MDGNIILFIAGWIVLILFVVINTIPLFKRDNRYRIKYDNKYGNFKKKEKITIDNQIFEILRDNGKTLYLVKVEGEK